MRRNCGSSLTNKRDSAGNITMAAMVGNIKAASYKRAAAA